MALLVEAPTTASSTCASGRRTRSEGRDGRSARWLPRSRLAGHVLLEGPPGSAKTLLARRDGAHAGRDVQAHPVHTGHDAGRADRRQHDPRRRADLLPRRGSRTSSSRTRSTARLRARSSAARGDAGARQVTVEEAAPAPRSVPRHRDAEPVRAPRRVRAPSRSSTGSSSRSSSTTPTRRASTRCSTFRTRESRPTCSARFAAPRRRRPRQGADELDSTELPEEVGRYMVAIARATRDLPASRSV